MFDDVVTNLDFTNQVVHLICHYRKTVKLNVARYGISGSEMSIIQSFTLPGWENARVGFENLAPDSEKETEGSELVK